MDSEGSEGEVLGCWMLTAGARGGDGPEGSVAFWDSSHTWGGGRTGIGIKGGVWDWIGIKGGGGVGVGGADGSAGEGAVAFMEALRLTLSHSLHALPFLDK